MMLPTMLLSSSIECTPASVSNCDVAGLLDVMLFCVVSEVAAFSLAVTKPAVGELSSALQTLPCSFCFDACFSGKVWLSPMCSRRPFLCAAAAPSSRLSRPSPPDVDLLEFADPAARPCLTRCPRRQLRNLKCKGCLSTGVFLARFREASERWPRLF